MALEEKDSASTVSLNRTVRVTDVVFHRNDSLPGIPLEIHVIAEVTVDGRVSQVVRRVPSTLVDLGWPGTSKTLKAHLFTVIDAAV